MSQEFIAVLDYMEKERGIKRELLYEAVHAALLAAARKSFGPARDLSVELDPKTGKIKAIARLLVVEKVALPHDEISLSKARLLKADAALGDTRQPVLFGSVVLMAIVGVVLLIACSNVANLLLARAAAPACRASLFFERFYDIGTRRLQRRDDSEN